MEEVFYNTAPIRELLQKIFTDEELNIFCYDYFRLVHEQFASGMSHSGKIQLLIEHCHKFEEFEKLLALLKNINSKQYEKFSPLIRKSLKTPVVDIRISCGQMVEITLRGDFSGFVPEIRLYWCSCTCLKHSPWLDKYPENPDWRHSLAD